MILLAYRFEALSFKSCTKGHAPFDTQYGISWLYLRVRLTSPFELEVSTFPYVTDSYVTNIPLFTHPPNNMVVTTFAHLYKFVCILFVIPCM